MSDDLVNIEINGMPLQGRKGSMIIEVADEANIRIPRFCYHKKLSIAANCRMCLVEVERVPKPLPACATPINEGMKVYTTSAKAIAAQKSTMEFLLINHPLDCPVCDQGGECELQDIAMGYGEDVSRYTEAKRVVKDKDIGPLVSTDMTRCIHCTRCVRFGAEIAGIRELGATGRGEYMEIGTYVEKTLGSEMSGNVIDLCPVGALNARPSRMVARSWEMIQHATIAPHDAIGSNIYLHTLRGKVMRTVPRDNESINETWISDRDRFSYQGLYSEDRLTSPMVKRNGIWEEIDWETALHRVAQGLGQISSAEIGALIAPNATLEEMYLLQKLLRAIGVHNIDHRLRQSDFSDQDLAPLFPWLGLAVEELEHLEALLLIGSNICKEQPIAAHRIRKAALRGAHIMMINPREFDFTFDVSEYISTQPYEMVEALAGIARVAVEEASVAVPDPIQEILANASVTDVHRAMAQRLKQAKQSSVLLGAIAVNHPAFSVLRALSSVIAEQTEAQFGYLPEAANSAGAWLAGMLPHRLPAGQPAHTTGLDVGAMWAAPRKAYLLFGVEPEYDCENPLMAQRALDAAEIVVVCAPFANTNAKDYADVLLPIATFAETAGTFINAEGRWQSFNGAGKLLGNARPGWKVLRVLGNFLDLEGFEYTSTAQIRDELKSLFSQELTFDNRVKLAATLKKPRSVNGLVRVSAVPIYALDGLVRRSNPLQQTAEALSAAVYLQAQQAAELGLADATQVLVKQDGGTAELPLVIDNGVPPGCVWIPTGLEQTRGLTMGVGPVELQKKTQ